ncbi:uracil-DNA glycosylase [Sphingomonas sp. SORGH_AS_0879]|uniref:uracil-DNA glycosylase n=1 Tax=Sphingomonas sp. SORGH_AS_0879 TaxID=3041790 RepID=UPI0027800FCB|nr:uracil-DNA glycosylase [Sphingomonas sp. SORGH_AS_0879]MDQ1229228.1 uracil-DNA glycosylase family 4 [Sphingomonas sp. SORGH_AS_0879]
MPDASLPAVPAPLIPIQPPRDCPLCPRLATVREVVAAEYPGWWNAPVPPFGDADPWLAVVGLAPGKHGAHRTGRPFTGDGAGPLLYGTLARFGLAEGNFEARVDDGLTLTGAVILNAVKCLPPENKPTPDEIRTCRPFLEQELAALPGLKVVIALGQIAHQSVVKALGGKLPKARFAHLAEHRMPGGGPVVLDSYHCSRYNQNTGRLTPEMFEAVFARAVELRG